MKVVVLAGGISTERDVSLSSGKMIYQALKNMGHQAVLLDVYLGYEPYREGFSEDSVFEQEKDWAKDLGNITEINPDISAIKAMRPDGDKNFFGPNVISICRQADVVFLALHGENGENGKVQACFDLLGITYTGNGHVGSAVAMDKEMSKDLFEQHGIPTPKGIYLKRGDTVSYQGEYPCIAKACHGGSSVGVCIASGEEELKKAVEEAFLYDEEVVVEKYIEGREFSVGVIEGKALPVIEIAPLTGFYDYKNKYQAGATVETCPAKLSEEQAARVQRYAEQAFLALRLDSYARIDFMMDKEGAFYCLEANTLPGMTPVSLLPQEAAAAGISFEQLCERILFLALSKRQHGKLAGE